MVRGAGRMDGHGSDYDPGEKQRGLPSAPLSEHLELAAILGFAYVDVVDADGFAAADEPGFERSGAWLEIDFGKGY